MNGCDNNSDNSIFDLYKSADRKDQHSFSNPHEALITHLHLDLTADFASKKLFGTATFDIESENAEEIIMDTRYLKIKKVSSNSNENIAFLLDADVPYLGQALHIPIDDKANKITIEYETTENSSALQWLSAEQTTDKKSPFLLRKVRLY